MVIIILLVSILASLVGAISGIGGGVIIKPVMDSFGAFPVSTINFLTTCAVLSMTIVTLFKNRNSAIKLDKRTSTILAIGGIAGGLLGKQLFDILKQNFENESVIGATQYILLIILTVSVLIFTINKHKVRPRQFTNLVFILLVGLGLGGIASFLGIGGGPINLAALYLFFSMDSKKAALNSIYIIFFSQLTNIVFTLAQGLVPDFDPAILIIMIIGGITGGLLGSWISKKLSLRGVDKLFCLVMGIIILVSIFNLVRFII